jgi:hypothetical protein
MGVQCHKSNDLGGGVLRNPKNRLSSRAVPANVRGMESSALSLLMARHFGRFHGDNTPEH